jgi:PadR family transcriptional regulator, regulatory protein AphA
MDYVYHTDGLDGWVEITDTVFRVETEDDALDIAALCTENGSSRLLTGPGVLGEKFYDLRSGLAGAVLQKFSNYRITFAAVIPAEKITGRFGEMVLEANKGKQFRFFTDRESGAAWISG